MWLLPKHQQTPSDVCVMVHGGAWILGRPEAMLNFAHALMKHNPGLAVFLPSYTLSKNQVVVVMYASIIIGLLCVLLMMLKRKHTLHGVALSSSLAVVAILCFMCADDSRYYPAHIIDISVAVHEAYKKYQRPVFLLGHSAGGHLVTLLTMQRRWWPSDITCIHDIVKGVIGVCGVYDGDRLSDTAIIGPILHHLVFKTQDEFAWPVDAVWRENRPPPPFLLFNSEVDWSLYDHSITLMKKIHDLGGECKHFIIEGTTHFNIRKTRALYDVANGMVAKINQFFIDNNNN